MEKTIHTHPAPPPYDQSQEMYNTSPQHVHQPPGNIVQPPMHHNAHSVHHIAQPPMHHNAHSVHHVAQPPMHHNAHSVHHVEQPTIVHITEQPVHHHNVHQPVYAVQPPMPPAHQSTIHIDVGHAIVGPYPMSMVCPACQNRITTSVRTENSLMTHVMALMLCPFLCCCIPYFVESLKNKIHHCPNCNAYIGSHNMMNRNVVMYRESRSVRSY